MWCPKCNTFHSGSCFSADLSLKYEPIEPLRFEPLPRFEPIIPLEQLTYMPPIEPLPVLPPGLEPPPPLSYQFMMSPPPPTKLFGW